jgi:putative endonuclease
MGKTYFAYIMSNKSRRLYVGTTSELQARVFKHKNRWYEGSFTARYRFDMLVYFETHSHPSEAIEREKEIKGWRREKKLRLVLSANPDWADLSAEWEEDESWSAIAGARSRPVLRQQPRRG